MLLIPKPEDKKLLAKYIHKYILYIYVNIEEKYQLAKEILLFDQFKFELTF